MKGIRAFLKGLPGGHRPPTGPLTTSEAAEAEELRQETLAKDEDRIEHEEAEAGRESDRVLIAGGVAFLEELGSARRTLFASVPHLASDAARRWCSGLRPASSRRANRPQYSLNPLQTAG